MNLPCKLAVSLDKKLPNPLRVCLDWTILYLGCSLAPSSQTVGLLFRNPLAVKATKMTQAQLHFV